MDWKWIRVEEVDGFDPLDLQITFLSRHLTFCSDTFSLVRFWPPKCQQTPVDTIKVREFQLIFKEFVISDYDMKSFLTFDTKQQTTDWQRLFVPNPDISNSHDVDKLTLTLLDFSLTNSISWFPDFWIIPDFMISWFHDGSWGFPDQQTNPWPDQQTNKPTT